jgi:hypothetical protein
VLIVSDLEAVGVKVVEEVGDLDGVTETDEVGFAEGVFETVRLCERVIEGVTEPEEVG